jgi:hypothetical protein
MNAILVRFRHCSLFQVACKQQSADIYHHKFEKWYRNAVFTKQPSEHYYLSHATFPFSRDRFLRPAVAYSRFLALRVNFWLLSSQNTCLKLMMVTSADRCLLEKVSKGPAWPWANKSNIWMNFWEFLVS